MPEIELSHGTIHYRDQGSGPVIVLIHGLLVNGTVWDRAHRRAVHGARCIVPDLPLGSHRIPMASGRRSVAARPRGLIAELVEKLELTDVTLVGNDTGGALCQLVCAYHPTRIGRLVLTNCDAFEHFPPPALSADRPGPGSDPGRGPALDRPRPVPRHAAGVDVAHAAHGRADPRRAGEGMDLAAAQAGHPPRPREAWPAGSRRR